MKNEWDSDQQGSGIVSLSILRKKDSTKYCLYSQRTQAFLFLSYTPVMVLDTKNVIPTSDAAGYESNGAESIDLDSAIYDKKIRVAYRPKYQLLKQPI